MTQDDVIGLSPTGKKIFINLVQEFASVIWCYILSFSTYLHLDKLIHPWMSVSLFIGSEDLIIICI